MLRANDNLINTFKNNFKDKYIKQDFDYSKLFYDNKKLIYKNIIAENIFFVRL